MQIDKVERFESFILLIDAAHKRGVRFGRPPIVIPENYEEYYKMWKDKKITAKAAAEALIMT